MKALTAHQRRMRMERRIVLRVVTDALSDGYSISIDNGGDTFELKNSVDLKKIMETVMATDDERLYFHKDGKTKGYVLFVYGNDGWDVMADCTLSIDLLMRGAEAAADKFQEIYA